MAKPSVTLRSGKGSALTYSELDTNFTNLKDATVTLKAGTGGTDVISDLNGTITLVAGSGVNITGDNTAKTVTIGYSESQNIFNTIAVAGQSDVVADTSSDTLTLVAGSNITLTTNSTTDSITIASTGGSSGNTFETIAVAGQSSVVADSATDTLTLEAGTGITLTTNSTTDTVTITSSASGTVNSGTATRLAYYASTGTAVSDLSAVTWDGTASALKIASGSHVQTAIVGDYAVGSYASFASSQTSIVHDPATSGWTNSSFVMNGQFVLYPSEVTATGAVFPVTLVTKKLAIGGGDSTTANCTVTTTANSENLLLNTFSGTDSGSIKITQGVNQNIDITPNGTGKIVLDGLSWPNADGTADQYLKTNGSGVLSWSTVSGSGLADIVDDITPQLGGNLDVNGKSIVSVTNSNISITPNGTGSIVLDGLNWPQADGTANQYLKTNGSGQLSWATVGGGLSDFVDDTTPQLGGNLDVNGNSIVSVSNGNITITPNGTGKIVFDGATKFAVTTGTPTTYQNGYYDSMLQTPVSWLKIDIGGSNYYIPLFQ